MHQIAIYSTDRSPKPNYCAATIESMVERSNGAVSRADITVFVSGSSSDYLSDQGVAVVDRDLDEDQSARSSVHNASFNMRRAILGAGPDASLFLCEDDIVLADEWVRRAEHLSAVLSQVQPQTGQVGRGAPEEAEFALALFFPYGPGSVVRPDLRLQNLGSGAPHRRGWWQPYAPATYWGNQCLRLSLAALRRLQGWLRDQSDESFDRPPDLVLKRFFSAASSNVGLFGCLPSLAQHVGIESVAVPLRAELPIARNFDQMREE